MSVITAILPSTRPQGRFVIEVEGTPIAMVSLETIERLHLRSGAPFEPSREAVERDAAILRVYDRALNMLAARGRASRELRRLLLKKGEPAELVDPAIERLTHVGFLNDALYARSIVHVKVVGQGQSRRRVQQELFRRGVDREVADEAIAEVLDQEDVDTGAILEAAARRKARSLRDLDPTVRQRRLWAFLARRGFTSDEIRQALRTLTAESEDAADGGGADSNEPDAADQIGR